MKHKTTKTIWTILSFDVVVYRLQIAEIALILKTT
jgi:hypothetical protein